MGDSRANLIMIGFILVLLFLYIVFPHIFSSFFEKLNSSRHDAKLRSKGNEQAFMQSGRLADRYAGLLNTIDSSQRSAAFANPADIRSHDISSPQTELNYCPYCGADISGLEEDDKFCAYCGSKLR